MTQEEKVIDPEFEIMDCPFCGGKAEVTAHNYRYIGICTNCGIRTQEHWTQKEVCSVWNLRQSNEE